MEKFKCFLDNRENMKKYLMEFAGTFFLVLAIGLSGNPLAIGLMLMAMVYIGGHVSGAHYNPAVTLAVWLRGKLESKKVVGYILSQVLGSFAAAFAVYLLTSKTFMPAPGISVLKIHALLIEILFTFVLAFVILTVATSKKFEKSNVYGIAIGLTLSAIIYAGANISGAAYNPAVAIGTIITSHSISNTTLSNLWIYLLGPFIGGAFAAVFFKYSNK